jgi:hypothetical protein
MEAGFNGFNEFEDSWDSGSTDWEPSGETPDIDFDAIVDEIAESREGRYRWTMVDSDMRIWDAVVVGENVLATTAELGEIRQQLVFPVSNCD